MDIVVIATEDLRRLIREETRALHDAVIALSSTTPTPTEEPLLTVEAVAARCSTNSTTVRAWIHSGKLAAQRARRRYLVRRVDLEAFLGQTERAPELTDQEHLSLLLDRLHRKREK